MQLFLSVVTSGLVNGLIYALVGLAFVLIFRVDGVINLALGECVMLGALFGYSLVSDFGLPLVVGAAGALALGGGIGATTELAVLRTLGNRDPLRMMILTFGIALVLQNVARRIWSTDLYSIGGFPGVPAVIRIIYDRTVVQGQAVWVAAFAAFVFGIWAVVLRITSMGRELRAVSDDREMAEAVGVPSRRLVLGAYVVGCGLAALLGFFVLPLIFFTYAGGTLLGLKGLVAALVGGLYRPLGPLAGGLLLGIGEAATAGYYSADWKDVSVFAVLITVLLVRPNGILSEVRPT